MVKYHVNPETARVNICRATIKCDFADANGVEPPHFTDKAEATRYRDAVLEAEAKKEGNFLPVKRKRSSHPITIKDDRSSNAVNRGGRRMTEREAELRDSIRRLADRAVEDRVNNNTVSLAFVNVDRAKKCLQNALSYTDHRGNTHLMEKLSSAVVLPSGHFFKEETKERFSTDDILDRKTAMNHIDEGRDKLVGNLQKFINSGHDVPAGKYPTVTNDAGTYSVEVKENQIDRDAFDDLPEHVQSLLGSEKIAPSLEKIRQKIPVEKQEEFVSTSQVFDYVLNNPHDLGQGDVKPRMIISGRTDVDKFNDGIKNIADFYDSAREKFGTSRKSMDNSVKDMTTSVKEYVADSDRNVYIPARSVGNGAVVSRRQNVSRVKAKEVLSEQEYNSVLAVSYVPDRDKAQKALNNNLITKETFDKIFNVKKVSLRVTEKD